MGSHRVLPIGIRVYFGVMSVKEYTTFPKLLNRRLIIKLFRVISKTFVSDGI